MNKVSIFLVGFCALISAAHAVVNFDDLTLSDNSYWNGQSKWEANGSPYPATPAESPFNYDEGFTSGGAELSNRFTATTYGQEPPYTNYTSWSGFAYSNMIDKTTAGFGNQYSAYTGAAASGSNFGVAYYTTWGGITPAIIFGQETAPTNLKLTNTTYSALSMRDGDGFTDPMGEGDWFKVTISAKDDLGQATGSVIDVTLGEWQTGGSMAITDEWLNVDLSALGNEVKTIEFSVSSWDESTGAAAQWPTYFAMDDLNTVPEPMTITLLGVSGIALIARKKRA